MFEELNNYKRRKISFVSDVTYIYALTLQKQNKLQQQADIYLLTNIWLKQRNFNY